MKLPEGEIRPCVLAAIFDGSLQDRIEATVGLTPEQVAAIPRLIYHFTTPLDGGVVCDPDPSYRHLETVRELMQVFPRREATS